MDDDALLLTDGGLLWSGPSPGGHPLFGIKGFVLSHGQKLRRRIYDQAVLGAPERESPMCRGLPRIWTTMSVSL